MSISKSQQARLGVFMAAGAVICCVMIAIPITSRLNNRQKAYIAYFSGESLSGLEEGAQVKFHGVPIGKVNRISYDPKDLTRVKAELTVKEDFPMKTDMYAETGAMGITGLKYVEILGGTDAAEVAQRNSDENIDVRRPHRKGRGHRQQNRTSAQSPQYDYRARQHAVD
jgi:ABC-type transporter Mla subunit MlaD